MSIRKYITVMVSAMAVFACGAKAQVTPAAYGAYISPSLGVWNPWTSAAAYGAIAYTPQAIALYCQASAGAAWTPCNPGSGGSGVTQLIAGSNITLSPISGTGVVTITASSTAATAFSGITSATNTQAAMLVGTGASFGPTGSGTVAATTLEGGATNDLVYQSAANTTGFIAPVDNAVLVTNGSGVPSESTTLPSGLTAPSLTVTNSFTATGLVTNNDLVNAATTVNGQSCALGSSCTVTANTPNALTMNSSGGGAASGTTYTGAAAVTLSYNTLGAAPLASPTFTGTVTIPNGGVLGTPASINLTNAAFPTLNQNTTGTAANITATSNSTLTTLTSLSSANGTTIPASVTLTQTIANGTATLGTGAISSGACATVVTVAGTGIATTDVIGWGFNGDPTSVVGYQPSTSGMLTVIAYPTSGNSNFKVCNNTAASVTPGAITLNWRVWR